jgi:hypothetical protein
MKNVVAHDGEQAQPAQTERQEKLMAESEFQLMKTGLMEKDDQEGWRNALWIAADSSGTSNFAA